MEVYLRIARLYLEEADHVSAEAYINRAGMLQSDVERADLHVIYKVRQHILEFQSHDYHMIISSIHCKDVFC